MQRRHSLLIYDCIISDCVAMQMLLFIHDALVDFNQCIKTHKRRVKMWFFALTSMCIEDWMIYRGPGFLTVAWFGSSHTLFPAVWKVPLFPSLPVCRRLGFLTGEGVRGWAWGRILRPKKAWHSINRSKLFDFVCLLNHWTRNIFLLLISEIIFILFCDSLNY